MIKRIVLISVITLFPATLFAQTDTLKQIEKAKAEKLVGTINDQQLSLYLDDDLVQSAISEELSDSLSIFTMLIHKDFDGALFFYLDGDLGDKPIVLRIKLFRKNGSELYITEKSYLEYCIAKNNCDSPAFGDLVGCKCTGGSSKNVEHHRIENMKPSGKGIGRLFGSK